MSEKDSGGLWFKEYTEKTKETGGGSSVIYLRPINSPSNAAGSGRYMGYMKNHSIIVTSWNHVIVKESHARDSEIFPWVSPVSDESMNGQTPFFIPPDGSKEGWPESDLGDARRKAFLDWCDTRAYEDSSNPISYVEIKFGGDEDGVYGIERVSRLSRK